MGRIYSGKPAKDTETAAESLVYGSLMSSTLLKKREAEISKSVTASLQSSPSPDDNSEKKFKTKK